jgi:hypothetical protein
MNFSLKLNEYIKIDKLELCILRKAKNQKWNLIKFKLSTINEWRRIENKREVETPAGSNDQKYFSLFLKLHNLVLLIIKRWLKLFGIVQVEEMSNINKNC